MIRINFTVGGVLHIPFNIKLGTKSKSVSFLGVLFFGVYISN